MPACAVCGYEAAEAFRFCPECGAAAATPTSEQRKVVTVLFCDVVGSTALGESTDPEALRALLARYFGRLKAIVERHGGAVEKFIGDAVMAVFGIPAAHEDDALRACRAAVEMRTALPELKLEGRIGVATGEVVTGTEERLATGDALNVAARLQQAARPGEALVGQETLALVRAGVDVEPVEALTLKGKVEPVPAYRLLAVRETAQRRPEARFVGRAREVALIHEAWERALSERRCELMTIVGEAGVGKSRLVAEALASLDARPVQGRCLPYGEGVTYWPVVEILKQLGALPSDETAAAAVRSLLGGAATSAEEIAWAFRKTLEQAAAEQPLIAVFDDIHWGEETYLDLLEHVALLSSGAPILLLAMARPELTERRPSWPVTFRVEPLGPKEVEELIPQHIAGPLRAKISRAGGGNPLFLEQMVAMAGEAGGEVVVPPTLQALLAARLDQLDAAERRALERGAVEGEVFHRGAVHALAGEDAHVTPRLASLVRKGLIRPEKSQLLGEDGFRFRHLLIRDAAYAGLPKATRADLHQRFAGWLENRGSDLVELEEILGYHLEQACHYRAELGTPDDTLAVAARRRLAAAGHQAALRQDYGAAMSLFERAAALVPVTEVDLALEIELGQALFWTGRGDEAFRRADALAERSWSAGDRVGELCGRLLGGMSRLSTEPEGATEELAALVEQALPVFEAAGNDLALYIAYEALGTVADTRGQKNACLEAVERALAHAQRAGHLPPLTLAWRASLRFFGTTPAAELLAWLDENEPPGGRDHFLRAYRAGSLAMLGRFDEARTILAASRAELAERGAGVLLANITAFESVWVELWGGNPAAAFEFGSEGWRLYLELGERGFLPGAAGNLAQALYALDRLDEADAWAGRAGELATSGDYWNEMRWRQVTAKVLARRGEYAEAERLAREAVAISDETDMLDAQGDTYADFAEVLALAGRTKRAVEALEQALARYERKENLVMAERVRARLVELQASETAAESVR